MAVPLARVRMPLAWSSVLLLVAGPFLGVPLWLVFGLFLVALAVYLRVGTVRRPPVEVALPVTGRWQALNTPADKVPSHGLHAYGRPARSTWSTTPWSGPARRLADGR